MRTTQRKGDSAVAQAIATFTRMGYDVSIPITESASYDLIVDVGDKLKRVQVKFTSCGQVDLRRIHSNSKGYVVRKSKESAYDWLYVLGVGGEEYLVEYCLNDRRSINLSESYLLKRSSSWRDARVVDQASLEN